MTSKPEVLNVRKTAGIAGQVRYTAVVRYPGEEDNRTVWFVGSTYGAPGPVLMLTENLLPEGIYVSHPERFGERFGPDWVRAFYAWTPPVTRCSQARATR